MNETQHAQRIVDRFKELIGPENLGRIDPSDLEQLELMIESAIDVSVLEAVNMAKDIAGKAAREISHIVEKI